MSEVCKCRVWRFNGEIPSTVTVIPCPRCDGCEEHLWGGWYSHDGRRYHSIECLQNAHPVRGCRSCGYEHDPNGPCLEALVSVKGVPSARLERVVKAMRRASR